MNRHFTTRLSLFIGAVLCLLAAALPSALAQTVPAPVPAAVDDPTKPLQPPHDKAALLRVSGEIDDVLFNSIRWRVDAARKAGCTLIILDIDSDGGLLASALDISKYIKNCDVPIVAWVHPTGYSSAAIVALACNQIVMASSASMGDCAPIAVDAWGHVNAIPEDLKAKVNSPLIEDLRNSAQRNHPDPEVAKSIAYLSEAMVVRELEVFELRNLNTGQLRYVGSKERDALLAVIDDQHPAGPNHVANHPWKLSDQPIDTDKTLLTVGTEVAINMGLAKRAPTPDGSVANVDQLRAVMNIRGDLLRMDSTWSEDLTRWLTNWWVRGALFVMMLVLAGVEFSHPGVTLPGIGALICLAILVGAPYLTGIAQVWEIVLIVLGLVIIVVDLVFYGGIGLLAIPGFILMALGLVASFVPPDPSGSILPTSAGAYSGLQRGLSVVVFDSIIALSAFYVLSRFFHLTPGFRRLQLAPVAAQPPAVVQDAAQRSASDVVFVGSIGLAQSDLRPAGKALFDRQIVDVVTQGEFVPGGSPVVVLEIAGPLVIVGAHRT